MIFRGIQRRLRARRQAHEKGFTLLEVLVAISLLSMGLMVLLDSQGGSMLMAQYSKDLTVATQLARARMSLLMQEIEDKKITYGISKSSCKEGPFSDDGRSFKIYTWKYCIKKVEIADPTNLPGLGSAGKDATADEKKAQAGQNAMALLSAMGVPTGGSIADIASSLGPMMGMIQGQMKNVFKQLKESLRELQVIVKWKRGGKEYKVAVTTHLFHFNRQTGMPDGWPQPKDQQPSK